MICRILLMKNTPRHALHLEVHLVPQDPIPIFRKVSQASRKPYKPFEVIRDLLRHSLAGWSSDEQAVCCLLIIVFIFNRFIFKRLEPTARWRMIFCSFRFPNLFSLKQYGQIARSFTLFNCFDSKGLIRCFHSKVWFNVCNVCKHFQMCSKTKFSNENTNGVSTTWMASQNNPPNNRKPCFDLREP